MVKEEVSCAVVEWITQTGGTSSVTWDPREPGAMTDRGARLAVACSRCLSRWLQELLNLLHSQLSPFESVTL
jgi:hypothetical protein